MLDAFIIEEIRRRERRPEHEERPAVELPLPSPPSHADEKPARPDRGVVIIDYTS
jgi:hypothetical protein